MLVLSSDGLIGLKETIAAFSQQELPPSAQTLFEALYLATFEATKMWTMPV